MYDEQFDTPQSKYPRPPQSHPQQSPYTAHPVQLIQCPCCGRSELAFVTEYHKATICKIFSSLILTLICIVIGEIVFSLFTSPADLKITSVLVCLALSFVLFILKMIGYIIESKTHVQAICKSCGHLWLLN